MNHVLIVIIAGNLAVTSALVQERRLQVTRIDGCQDRKDIFELQLFNFGGVVWNQGIPDQNPPAAKGLQLIYADDFDGPLSISSDGRGSTYMAHNVDLLWLRADCE